MKKFLLINIVLITSLIMSSLSWAWDGDVEAELQGHSISIEQHNALHHQDDAKQTLANHDTELDHDHHCNISAHLTFAMLSQPTVVKPITKTFKALEYVHLYLPPDSQSALRPPIA